MSDFPPAPVLRPRRTGLAGWWDRHQFGILAGLMNLLRGLVPVVRIGKLAVVIRYDDVRAVLGDDRHFAVPYAPALEQATGRPLFFLGENDPARLGADIALLSGVMRADDIPGLADQAAAAAKERLASAPGRIELVDGFVRSLVFDLFARYLGVAEAASAEIHAAASQLFEFVFYQPDATLRAAAPELAGRLMAAVDRALAAPPEDSVAARCRAAEAGDARYTADWVRSTLAGLVIGGPPQPVIVLAQVMDVLLARPEALRGAQAAARAGDDAALLGYILEALRFHPLAPALPRVARTGAVVGRGTDHARALPEGTRVLVGIAGAMGDPRRLADPDSFDPRRPGNSYLHFGYGAHSCFAARLNAAVLPAMLRPLLQVPGLRRAPGKAGRLRMNGPFPECLWLEFDRDG